MKKFINSSNLHKISIIIRYINTVELLRKGLYYLLILLIMKYYKAAWNVLLPVKKEDEMMKVNIPHEAEQYIMGNGGTVTVLLGSVSGCCGGAAPMPQIQLGSPEDISAFTPTTIGNITVYTDKQIDVEKQINISLEKLLWIKKLSVQII